MATIMSSSVNGPGHCRDAKITGQRDSGRAIQYGRAPERVLPALGFTLRASGERCRPADKEEPGGREGEKAEQVRVVGANTLYVLRALDSVLTNRLRPLRFQVRECRPADIHAPRLRSGPT